MDPRDKNNLKFLLKSPQSAFDDWLEHASNDDIEYALEIIRNAKAAMLLEWIELTETTDGGDFAEANIIIQTIKQKMKQ
jgi:isopropylmalate/homocitrate/citramalate synthase